MRTLDRFTKARRAALAALVSALAVTSSIALIHHEPREAHAQAPGAAPEVPVATVIVRDVDEATELTGHLAAAKTVELRARVPGYVQSLHFTEGQLVSAGQLLFQLDARPFQAARDRRLGELDEAKAKLALAKTELARSRELFTRAAVPEQEIDARAANERSLEALTRAASASVTAAALDVSFTRVTAPISGRIGRALVTEGNAVAGGAASAPLATIVSVDPMHLYFDVDETTYLAASRRLAPKLRGDGLVAQVGLVTDAGYPRPAKIDFVDNRVDTTTGTVRLRAVLPNPDGALTPGLFARVRLPLSDPHPTILVDDAAIGTEQGKRYVLVLGKDDVVQYRAVELGPVAHGLRVVRKGLEPGEVIVRRGLVRPGMKVAPRPGPMVAEAKATEGSGR